MSPIDGTLPGIKGKRVPGRPGRFDPSEPLHMTTRRAAKTTTNGSPSLNGSVEDDESRRGSMDDSRPFTSYSNGSQFSMKSRRPSDASMPTFTPENQLNGTYSSGEKASEVDETKPISLALPSPSPTRKRKRSSSPAPPSTPQQQETTAATSFEDYQPPAYADDVDSVEVLQPDELSDRDVPPSQVTSDSAEDVAQNDGDLVAPSIDATPAISGHVSPVTSDSDNSQDDVTNVKQLDAALEVARAEQDEPDEGDEGDEQDDRDEIDDAAEAVEDLDDAEDVDEPARSDDDGRPRRGRFGGRRRAKHHIPRVEMAMQRQSELKSAYRVIARAQKAVLAEIAQRTVDNLVADANLHLQADEYENVEAGLDESLKERRGRLQAQHEWNRAQLKQTLDGQQQVIKATKKRQVEDLEDDFIDGLEYRILEIARAAHLHADEGGHETEDEDDVLPRPKGMGYRWKRAGKLDSVYDSRSRFTLETRRAIVDMEKRFMMQKMLDNLPEEDKPEELKGFTVGSVARREMAVERKNSLLNTKTLADAAAEVERLECLEQATRKSVIPNAEAHGLQLLGDLASRPSIIGSAPGSGRLRQNSDSRMGQRPARPMPPHLQLHTHYGPSRIPVEMSPRTTQALNDRFESGQPPPTTPREAATPSIRSPEVARKEFHLQSPPSNNNDADNFRSFPSKHIGHRSESYSGTLADQQRTNDRQQSYGQGSGFGPAPFPYGDRKRAPPALRNYSSERSAFPTFRAANDDETARRGFFARPPVGTPTMREGRDERDPNKNGPPFSFLHGRPVDGQDRASEAGALDARDRRESSPQEGAPRATMDSDQSPPRRWSTFTSGDYRSDSHLNHEQHKPKHQFPPKLNKAERNGLPRRWNSSKDNKKMSGPLNKPGPASANSPTSASSPFAGSPVERPGPPAPWQHSGPPLRSPLGPPPPSAFGQAPSQGHQGSPFPGGVRDLYQHRESFSSRPPPASIWNQPSPSPLYAVPGPQHPPPPGAPPEQYNRFGPPPPPGFPPPPQTPQTSNPQSAPSSSYGPQFGGTPLAPAMNQGFHPPGFRPSGPIPAFAQQAQQQQQQSNSSNNNSGTPGQRRRAQSDASFPKFQPWQPPPTGRR